MEFDYVVDRVLKDERAKNIPVLFILQVLIIMDDLGLI